MVTLITDELVFAGNSAVLEHKGTVILDAVNPALVKIDNQLQVDGHTNQLNVSTAPYPSGWELSSARASSVVRYLIEHGHIAAHRLSAAGYSDQRPLVPPSDPTLDHPQPAGRHCRAVQAARFRARLAGRAGRGSRCRRLSRRIKEF